MAMDESIKQEKKIKRKTNEKDKRLRSMLGD